MLLKLLDEIFVSKLGDLNGISASEQDREMLRLAMVAELDAVNLYTQMSERTKHPLLKKLFLDVAKEEKTHVGEFQSVLLDLDPEYGKELKQGDKEVDDMK